MRRKTVISGLLLILAVASSSAQEKGYAVEGVIRFTHDGDICVILVQAETFGANGGDARRIVLHPTAEQRKAGAIRFSFTGVLPGEYGVKAFVDRNRNGIHDRNFLGIPVEPWGMSWKTGKPFGFPRFSDISFQLQGNIDIDVTVE
jgi:uncharacterized protein (DUF2141 family)